METKSGPAWLILKLIIASSFLLAVFEVTEYTGLSHGWQVAIVLGALAIVGDMWDSIKLRGNGERKMTPQMPRKEWPDVAAELMTAREYRSYMERRDRDCGIAPYTIGSLHWTSKADAAHGAAVRKAVEERRPVHVENKLYYHRYIPALCWYTVNGNIAVYDTVQREVFPTFKAVLSNRQRQHKQAVNMIEAEEAKNEMRTGAIRTTVYTKKVRERKESQ